MMQYMNTMSHQYCIYCSLQDYLLTLMMTEQFWKLNMEDEVQVIECDREVWLGG